MSKLLTIFATRKRLWQQQQEIEQLRARIEQLQAQNTSMREGMRRCLSCDYRIDYKQRLDARRDAAELNKQQERTDVRHFDHG